MQIKRLNDPSGISVSIDVPVEGESYVQRILTENEIPGLCRLRIRNTDGERRCCFQIGKMLSLQEAAERGDCGKEMLCRILKGLAGLKEELENYLMEMDCLILEPELIFLAEEGQLRFCACPGRIQPAEESLMRLIGWFYETGEEAGKEGEEGFPEARTEERPSGLDREGRDALLALCAEPEPDLKKMAALLEPREPEEEPEPVPLKERQAALPGWVRKGKKKAARKERRKKGVRLMERIGSLLMPVIGAGVELLLWKSGMLTGFSRWIQAGIYGFAALFFVMLTLILRSSENRRLMGSDEALDLLPPPEGEDLPRIRFEDTLEYDAEELEEISAAAERGETVLLSELMIAGSALGILISRQPERRPNIYVTASPFRIGKEGSGADAEPASRYLSREHALIEATESGCRLRDEGSTNGTFVNGDRLLPGQWAVLADGDEVRFADAAYRYRQGCRDL